MRESIPTRFVPSSRSVVPSSVLIAITWLVVGCGGASASGADPMEEGEALERAESDDDSADLARTDSDDADEAATELEVDEDEGRSVRGSVDEADSDAEREDDLVAAAGDAEDGAEQDDTDGDTQLGSRDVPESDRIVIDEDPTRDVEDASDESEPELASWLTGNKDDAELEIVDDLSVLVIFDNSGSMDTFWDGESRWAVANRALYDAIAPVRTSLTVGAIRFPTDEQCGVSSFDDEIQFGFSLADEFLDRWARESALPFGSTPLSQAFLAADAAIANASERELLADRFNVIVVTDGEPNCEGDLALLTELPAKWLERGVLTHVLGLPGSTAAATLLNDIAEAGGTEHFQQLGTADELEQDLVRVTR